MSKQMVKNVCIIILSALFLVCSIAVSAVFFRRSAAETAAAGGYDVIDDTANWEYTYTNESNPWTIDTSAKNMKLAVTSGNTNGVNNEIILGTRALRKTPLSQVVNVSMRMKITVDQPFTEGCQKIGFYPYYRNESDFVYVSLSQWWDGSYANLSLIEDSANNFLEFDSRSLGIADAELSDMVLKDYQQGNVTEVWFGVDLYADRVEFRYGKTEDDLSLIGNTSNPSFVYTFRTGNITETDPTNVYIGFGGNAVSANYSDVTIQSMDGWYTQSSVTDTDENTWLLNGAGNGSEWTIDDGRTAVLRADFVQDLDGGTNRLIDRTYAVRPTMADAAFDIAYTAKMTVDKVYTYNNACTKFGLIPFFLDENNYVAVKLSQWADSNNSVINITGKIEGSDLVNDANQPWSESAGTGINIRSEGTAITMKVRVYADRVEVYLDGSQTAAHTYAFKINSEGTPAAVSFSAQNDLSKVYAGFTGNQRQVTFSEFSADSEQSAEPAEPFTEKTVNHGGVDWKVKGEFGNEWILGENDSATLSVTHNNGNDNNNIVFNTYALRPSTLDSIVGVSMRMRITINQNFSDTGNNKIGFYPFYQDATNYLFVNLSQWSDMRTGANFNAAGVLNGNNIGGAFNYIENDTQTLTQTIIRNSGAFWFGADFYADRVEFRFGAEAQDLDTVKATYTFAVPLDVSALSPDAVTYIGYGGNSDSATFSDMTFTAIEEPSVPAYTEQDRTVGDVVWKVNGAHNGEEWTLSEDGTAVLMADFVQDQNSGRDRLIDKTYAVRPALADTAVNVRYKAVMTVNEAYTEAGCTKFGLMPFYVDQNNYILVKLSQWQDQSSAVINVTGRLGGSDLVNTSGSPWYESGATGINIRVPETSVTISVSVFADCLYVYLNDGQIPVLTYDYRTASGLTAIDADTDASDVYVGFAGNQKKVTFSQLSFEADEAVSDEIGGGWTTDYPFGWTYDAENQSIEGTSSGESNIYHETELRGGWVITATVIMSDSVIAEGTQGVLYKAGLTPFYKDANNYISVWIQQYGNDSSARIVAKGLINGQPIVDANSGGYWEGIWFETFSPVTENTQFVMKCEVTERAVNVYVDGEYVASLRTASGIPFGSNEPALSYGAIIENGTAEFSEISLQDSSAIVTETVITVTVKTTEGTNVTDATVTGGGQTFANNGDGTYTLTVPVRSSITITVEKAGYETVTYTVETSAMYQPEVARIIEIAEEEKYIIPEFNDEDPSGVNVGALVGGIVGGVVAVAAAVVISVLVIRKKKKAAGQDTENSDENSEENSKDGKQ